MAIDRIADYYPRFRRRLIIKLVILELFAIIAFVSTIAVSGNLPHIAIGGFWYIVAGGILALLQLIMIVILFRSLSEPILVITQAVNHVAKQATDLPPPDINEPRFVRSGLKQVVQTIYDLALNAPEIPNAIPTTGNAEARIAAEAMNAAHISNLIEALPCGVICLDAMGQIAYANRQAPVAVIQNQGEQMTLQFEQGKGYKEWHTEASQKLRDTHIWQRIADKLPEEEGRRIFDVVAVYEKSSVSGYDTIIVTIDRTEMYQRAEEDTDFIALAAHELRGPITVIRGYLDVIRDELSPVMRPDQKELIDRLNVSANRLSGYINNILNVSRYDRRHLQLHLHEMTVAELVNNLWPDLDMRARTQNRILTADIAPDLPTIAADQNSLSEVLSNLVDNAIKYSNDGGQVVVSVKVKDNFVEFSVRDFGIGIPASVAGNLFSKFYRSHVSRSTVAGTGLGLYISKAIIDSHGGQIWVNSTEGQGSTFGFTVPIYSTVADKLAASAGSNDGIIESSHGWIKNHAMVRK